MFSVIVIDNLYKKKKNPQVLPFVLYLYLPFVFLSICESMWAPHIHTHTHTHTHTHIYIYIYIYIYI